MSKVENCPDCGGTHFGSHACPYIKAPCIVCGAETVWACSDCAIDAAGKRSTHICKKTECRDVHERDVHGVQAGVGIGLGVPTNGWKP